MSMLAVAVSFLFVFSVVVAAGFAAAGFGVPAWVIVAWLFLISTITFTAYRIDKQAAGLGSRRTKESTLLTLCLLGGAPGGFIGSQIFRHKTAKVAYRVKFWLVVLAQGVIAGWILTVQYTSRDTLLSGVRMSRSSSSDGAGVTVTVAPSLKESHAVQSQLVKTSASPKRAADNRGNSRGPKTRSKADTPTVLSAKAHSGLRTTITQPIRGTMTPSPRQSEQRTADGKLPVYSVDNR